MGRATTMVSYGYQIQHLQTAMRAVTRVPHCQGVTFRFYNADLCGGQGHREWEDCHRLCG